MAILTLDTLTTQPRRSVMKCGVITEVRPEFLNII
jgi:hypothetical protein